MFYKPVINDSLTFGVFIIDLISLKMNCGPQLYVPFQLQRVRNMSLSNKFLNFTPLKAVK